MMRKTQDKVVKFDSIELINAEKIIQKDERRLVVFKRPKGPKMILPRYIRITNDLAWSFGFFIAEGHKTHSGVEIANREVYLIEKFKKAIEESFGIKNENWRLYVKTPSKDLENIKKKWITTLHISKTNVNYLSKARQDIIDLRINNTLFSVIFNILVKKSLPKILENRELLINFLDGYEVGDGSVIQRNGYLYGIVITVKNKFMKDYLVKAFRQLYNYSASVRRTKGSYEIMVRGIHMMTQLILDGHFKSSERQWKKLVSCYLKKEYTRSHIRYWFTFTNGFLAINDIAVKADRSHWSVRDALNKDTELGLTIAKRVHVPNKKGAPLKFYSLSENGKKLIKILKEVICDGEESIDIRCGGT
jgi:hypothetical protein